MEQTRRWTENTPGNYSLLEGNKTMATMQVIAHNMAQLAHAKCNGRNYTIEKTGFWKTNIEVKDENGHVLMHLKPEKWYSSSYLLTYEGDELNVTVRNNPLVEYNITCNGHEQARYKLSVVDGSHEAITEVENPSGNLLFDCLLWYIFLPITKENTAGGEAADVLVMV